VGLLWTPGYWGWRDGIYAWNAGYWGPHIGFYGGINYGFGYTGVGYAGGFWRGGVFSYNRTVNNFGSVSITNNYSKTVINNTRVTNVSFNGGAGGTSAKATPQELAAANEQHTPSTAAQTQHQNLASANPALHAANNGGHPQIAATSHSGQFSGAGVVGARTTGPGGRNPAVGATANRGPAGGSGTPGAGNRPNNVTGPGGAGPAKLTSTGPGGPGQGKLTPSGPAGPRTATGPGGAGPGRVAGGGPPRPANFARPNGGGPRPGGGGGPHPGKGPPPHH
jgi:hypothetical protein